MPRKVKHILIPGALAFAASGLIQLALFRLAGYVWFIHFDDSSTAIMWPWLLCITFVGSATAYLAARFGASVASRFLAVIFPFVVMLGILVLALACSLFVDAQITAGQKALAFTFAIVCWVILPAGAGIAGALPFLAARRAEAEHR